MHTQRRCDLYFILTISLTLGVEFVRLTRKGRYIVMAMIDLAKHGEGRPVALADIAERQGISLTYLEQLFQKLRQAQLIKSVRGPGGGYLLAREASTMPVTDIIAAVDEPLRATRCAPGAPLGCTGANEQCLAHEVWDELSKHIHMFLSSVTLYDVVEGRIQRSALAGDANAA